MAVDLGGMDMNCMINAAAFVDGIGNIARIPTFHPKVPLKYSYFNECLQPEDLRHKGKIEVR